MTGFVSLITTLIVLSLIGFGSCARILALFPLPDKGPKNAMLPIAEALAERGHLVTIVTPFAMDQEVPNIHEIVMTELLDQSGEEAMGNWYEMNDQGGVAYMVSFLLEYRELAKKNYKALMGNRELRGIIESQQVDLLLLDALGNPELGYIIADHLKVPFVVHCSISEPLPMFLASMGGWMEYASVPTFVLDTDSRPSSFSQRLFNMVASEALRLVYDMTSARTTEGLASKDFPRVRSVAEIQQEMSLLIIDSHPAIAWPRSLPPAVLALGALHTRPARALPEALRKFVDEAEDGFIVFTLGSYVPVSAMPADKFQAFIQAFAGLPQRIVWKWESQVPPTLPPGIMTAPWLPQQDLLGHPNARLFITHGGLHGVQEALYHGVPMLCLPFILDQKNNANKVKREGAGLRLDWNELNEETLHDAIHRLINDPSFKGNATRLSGLLRDEPMPGRDLAAYWIEHVLRHNGTKHLQLSSKEMPLYQVLMLDVIAFLLLLGALGLYINYRILRWILSKLFRAFYRSTLKSKTN